MGIYCRGHLLKTEWYLNNNEQGAKTSFYFKQKFTYKFTLKLFINLNT